MKTTSTAQPTLSDLVSHMEFSHDLARLNTKLAAEADANDVELDQLIARSGYTVSEVKEAMLARWAGQ